MGRRAVPIAPISRETALARETELNNTQHFERVAPPTDKKYDRMLSRWREFHAWRSEDPNDCLQQRELPPNSGKLKMFMEYIFDTSVGLFAARITLKSLKNSWYSFRSCYERTTYNSIPTDVGTDVLCYIKTVLRGKGLSMLRRKKYIADQLDVAWLLTFLWCFDKHHFRHPRERLSLSNILLLLIYTGMRAGSIVESSAYLGSNQALCYKDFELIGLPRADGDGMELVLKVRFRYEKGKRAADGDDDESVKYKWVTFHEDLSCRGRCPISHFLGHAVPDDVFEGPRNPRDFSNLRVPANAHSMVFEIKESKRETPIFRRCEPDGTISEDRAMTYKDLAVQLLELGYRAGLRDPLYTYNLRRGTANAIDGDVTVSANQYSQLLGHSVKTMGEHYISNISAIDGQGILNGETPRKDHIQQLRGMSLNLNLQAPVDLPFSENQAILDDKEFVQLLSEERTLHAARDISPESRKDYETAIIKRKGCYSRLYAQARKTFRTKFFSKAGTEEMLKQIREGESENPWEPEDTKSAPNGKLDFVSPDHFNDRHFLAHYFWISSPQNIMRDYQMLTCMHNLCNPEPFVLYYPGETPVEGRCPHCKREMQEIAHKNRSDHIHSCFLLKNTQLIKDEFDRDCPGQCKWAKCRSRFTAKINYLSEEFGSEILDLQERKRARRIEAKRLCDQRRKPGNANVTPSSQSQPRKSISGHLTRHVKGSPQCLWDGCGLHCISELALRRHLYEMHQVNVRQAAFSPKFCFEHPKSGWFLNEFDWEDHCEAHLKAPSPGCNLDRAYGAFISGLQCPFCLGKEGALASDRITQFTDRGTFNRHMEFHEKKLPKGPIDCPFPGCPHSPASDYQQLWIHFSDVHQLKQKGFAKSRGFMVRSANNGDGRKRPEREDSSGSSTEVDTEDGSGWEDVDSEEDEGDWDDEGDWEDGDDSGSEKSPKRKFDGKPTSSKRKKMT